MTDAIDNLLVLVKSHRMKAEYFRNQSIQWKAEYDAAKKKLESGVPCDRLKEANDDIARLRKQLADANDDLDVCEIEYQDDMDAAKKRIASLEAELRACRASMKREREADSAADAAPAPPQKKSKNEIIRDLTYDHVTKGPDGKLIMAVSDEAAGIMPTQVSIRFVDKMSPSTRTYRAWYVITESGSVYCRSFIDVVRMLGATA